MLTQVKSNRLPAIDPEKEIALLYRKLLSDLHLHPNPPLSLQRKLYLSSRLYRYLVHDRRRLPEISLNT